MSPKSKKRVIKKNGKTKATTTVPKAKKAPKAKEEKPIEEEFEELEAMTLPDPTLLDKGEKTVEDIETEELPELEGTPQETAKEEEPPEPEEAKRKPSRPVRKSKKAEPPKPVEPAVEPEVAEPSKEEEQKEIKPLESMKEVDALLEEDEKPLQIKKTLLILGIILCGLGLIGMLGLRAGFVQSLLGDAAPYPGIGTVEPTGHIVSVVPIVIGIVTIFAWGLKNNPAYYELEKRKDKAFAFEESDEPEDTPEPVGAATQVSEELKEPLADVKPSIKEPAPPKVKKPVEEPSALAQKYAKAEDERVAECERILKAANLGPNDEKRLGYLIATGITPEDFTTLVEKAEKKKKEEEQKKMTSEQKAVVLEKELAAELAELEEELNDEDDEKDIEAKILKEIEDLEGL